MAVDSAAKRGSALFAVGNRFGFLVVPDGTISQPDFQDIAGFYRGIQAAAPAGLQTVTLLSATVVQPTISISVPTPSITASVVQPTLSSITVKNDIT